MTWQGGEKRMQKMIWTGIGVSAAVVIGTVSLFGTGGLPPRGSTSREKHLELHNSFIEEIEKIDAIQNQIKQYVELPAVTSGMIMKNSQYAISFALMGIGGVMIKESKMCDKFTDDKEYAKVELSKCGSSVLCLELNPEHITGKLVNES